jgi:hypothetical protein
LRNGSVQWPAFDGSGCKAVHWWILTISGLSISSSGRQRIDGALPPWIEPTVRRDARQKPFHIDLVFVLLRALLTRLVHGAYLFPGFLTGQPAMNYD